VEDVPANLILEEPELKVHEPPELKNVGVKQEQDTKGTGEKEMSTRERYLKQVEKDVTAMIASKVNMTHRTSIPNQPQPQI